MRITPAGAGKTYRREMKKKELRDHPRRCGENGHATLLYGRCNGSPPQVRGKLVDIVVWVVGLRITPAGAGKTIIYHRMHSESRDHPRRCGENKGGNHENLFCKGSPPQVRGKLSSSSSSSMSWRITPAGAGKTSSRRRRQMGTRDHPRRCGENFMPLKACR